MLIDWRKIALNIYDELKEIVSRSKKKISLWAILVWNNESSIKYINQKKKWADYIWINFVLKKLDSDISEEDLLKTVDEFNKSEEITWFIVQLPLAKHIDENKIIEKINPWKDVDWFHPINQWKLLIWDDSWIFPCTPIWIMEFFKLENIDFSWKHVVVIWRSNIVWKPVINLLINAWATVTSCNSKTINLEKFTQEADIVIVAAWKPGLLKASMINRNSIVIDVWFTVVDWSIYWDAITEDIDSIWAKVTPVPGWVWALTVAMLMKNTLKAWKIIF